MNKPLNLTWESVLADPHRFNAAEYSDLVSAADDWRFCAVGEKLGFVASSDVKSLIVTALEIHYPTIAMLGNRFSMAIANKNWDEATGIHKRITELMTPAVVEKLRDKVKVLAYLRRLPIDVCTELRAQIMEVVVGTHRRQAPAGPAGTTPLARGPAQ